MTRKRCTDKGAEGALALLREIGPMTRGELEEVMFLSRQRLTEILTHLRNAKLIHIKRWARDDPRAHIGRGYPRPVYAVGGKKDAKRPPPLKWADVKHKRRPRKLPVDVKVVPNSVFALASLCT